ncbi:hypothetical protein M405DRAFT_880411 [Rhizopogon salebrosus TDB-379]|nr:hypothetical protein M405DRAFT_880411 [Rhizopogon salebrosus TDB-379]
MCDRFIVKGLAVVNLSTGVGEVSKGITREDTRHFNLEFLNGHGLFVYVHISDLRSTEQHVDNAVAIHYYPLPYFWNTIPPLLHVQQNEAPVTGQMIAADTPVHHHLPRIHSESNHQSVNTSPTVSRFRPVSNHPPPLSPNTQLQRELLVDKDNPHGSFFPYGRRIPRLPSEMPTHVHFDPTAGVEFDNVLHQRHQL